MGEYWRRLYQLLLQQFFHCVVKRDKCTGYARGTRAPISLDYITINLNYAITNLRICPPEYKFISAPGFANYYAALFVALF